MKKVTWTLVFAMIMCILSSCGQTKNSGDMQTNVISRTTEINDDTSENIQSEEQAITDLYEGEYSDYDVNEPSLEIKKNNDETYQIQIKIYRLFYLDDGMGKVTEEGLKFVATGPNGNKINGVIRLEEDIATVTFFSQEWVDFAGLSEYKFYKTSNVPNIYVYE